MFTSTRVCTACGGFRSTTAELSGCEGDTQSLTSYYWLFIENIFWPIPALNHEVA